MNELARLIMLGVAVVINFLTWHHMRESKVLFVLSAVNTITITVAFLIYYYKNFAGVI